MDLKRKRNMYLLNVISSVRHIKRYKAYAALNVFGLALGMASVLLILIWVEHEVRVDRFHANGDHLYMMRKICPSNGHNIIDESITCPFAPVIEREIPEVVSAVRVTWENRLLFNLGEKTFYEEGHYADSTFFKVFSFSLVRGDASTVLNDPNSVVISQKLAAKYFGKEEAVGRTIRITSVLNNRQDLYTVTGVFQDVGSYSSVQFDYVIPFSKYYAYNQSWLHWGNFNMMTFLQLRPGVNAQEVERKLNEVYQKNGSWKLPVFFLQPLKDVYLHGRYGETKEHPSGLILYVKIFSWVAVLITLLVCMNYTNLSTAIASKRGREIGVKKVFGSSRKGIFAQFTMEAAALTVLGFLLAVLLVWLVLPPFNKLIDAHLVFDLKNPGILLVLVAVPVVTALLAGVFPAFYLSAFKPISVLKGGLGNTHGLPRLRQVLVVLQFVIAITFITASIFVFKQVKYLNNQSLGLNKDNILYFMQTQNIREHREAFRQELEKQPGVLSVTFTDNSPVQVNNDTYGVSWPGKDPDENVSIPNMRADYGFCKTFDVSLVSGRNFRRDAVSDDGALLVNETLARIMRLGDPVGKTINLWGRWVKVVGVVKDFHIKSLHQPILPLLIINQKDSWLTMVRFEGGRRREALENMAAVYKRFEQTVPFEYQFMDEEYAKYYETEKHLSAIANVFTVLTIVISCLGLFGLALFTIEQKTKEIGVRKSIGAKTVQVMSIMTLDFMKWIFISLCIANLVAYFAVMKWLNNFAFHTEMNWWVFVLTSLVTVLVALVTVGWQVFRAASRNPVEVLKYE